MILSTLPHHVSHWLHVDLPRTRGRPRPPGAHGHRGARAVPRPCIGQPGRSTRTSRSARRRLRRDVAAGGARKPAREREPEACAAAVAVAEPHARLEDPLARVVRDARPVIGDRHDQAPVGRARVDAHAAAGVAAPVLEQRREDPLDHLAVHAGHEPAVAGVELERDRARRLVPAAAQALERRGQLAAPGAEAGVGARRGHQRLEDLAHLVGAAGDRGVGVRARLRAALAALGAARPRAMIRASGVRSSCESSAESRCSWRRLDATRSSIESSVRASSPSSSGCGAEPNRRGSSCPLHVGRRARHVAHAVQRPADQHPASARAPRRAAAPPSASERDEREVRRAVVGRERLRRRRPSAPCRPPRADRRRVEPEPRGRAPRGTSRPRPASASAARCTLAGVDRPLDARAARRRPRPARSIARVAGRLAQRARRPPSPTTVVAAAAAWLRRRPVSVAVEAPRQQRG